MSRIAGFDARGAVDASGVPIAPADLPETLKRDVADRQETIGTIQLLHENDSPQNCQDND